MGNNRRDFIKKSGSLAATLSLGGGLNKVLADGTESHRAYQKQAADLRDAGMQMCEAYFFGVEEQKKNLCRQMDVLGAVGGVDRAPNAKLWDYESIMFTKANYAKYGLNFRVVEGPPGLGDKTKLGLDGRDEEIANFITFMKNLTKAGLDTVCYNWMPVISWFRTDMAKPGRGGALMTAFDNNDIKDTSLTKYGPIPKDELWKNLEYFLKAVVPEAEKCGVKLAMHPDDPQVDQIRGISRIMTTVENFKRMLDIYPSPNNGITLCQGNFSLMGADIPTIVKDFGKRKVIHFVHFRNVMGGKFKFTECFHDEGQIDMYAAMKAYYDIGFKGPIRPDHVPTMYNDSNTHPGYSVIGCLYANGYMRGLMEAVSRIPRKYS
jgi:mannonate dehydratase